MLKQLRFCRLYIYSFIEILLNYFGEIFQSFHNTTNLQGCCSKTGRVDFPEKKVQQRSNIYNQSARFYLILSKETRESCQFCFCGHYEVIKYRKTWRFHLSARRLLENF